MPPPAQILYPMQPVNRAHPLAQGLKAWWLVYPGLNGAGTRWRDLMQGIVGTFTNITGPTTAFGWKHTTRRGGFGDLRLSGENDTYVATTEPTSTFFSASTGTVTAWIYPTGGALTSSLETVYALQAVVSEADGNWGIARGIVDGGTDSLWFYNFGGADTKGIGVTIPTLDRWMHVAWVHGGGTLRGYLNGVYIGSVTNGNTDYMTGSVGLAKGYTPYSWTGRLDDIRFYNRALSAPEILVLYHNSLQGYPGLLNRWRWPSRVALSSQAQGPRVNSLMLQAVNRAARY